jgi:hypothetical protein
MVFIERGGFRITALRFGNHKAVSRRKSHEIGHENRRFKTSIARLRDTMVSDKAVAASGQ